ncbi:hypothetical protein Pa4123_90740 [Phytohabitans aurantiacus]|uniref:Uncharacterized protein n=1 Tax=Phytohabitans aurantiacus TaxID=3016789 RepID=A0ABQ5RAN1_9ACTN|nr:hypothetical protein Pa4123_90740 [Phytohabitans aurantiacus]
MTGFIVKVYSADDKALVGRERRSDAPARRGRGRYPALACFPSVTGRTRRGTIAAVFSAAPGANSGRTLV